MKSAGIGVGLIAGVVALIWLGSGFFIVQEGQQAVVTSFGSSATRPTPASSGACPYPIQATRRSASRSCARSRSGATSVMQATGLRDSSMLTQDENIVDIRFTVQYRLNDARAYLFENRDPEERWCRRPESAVREIVGRTAIDARALRAARRDRRRARQVDPEPARPLNAGIVVANVNMQRVACSPPEQVQAAFDDAQGRPGRRPPQERGPGLRQRRDPRRGAPPPACARRPRAIKAAVVAQAEGDAQRFRRC